jgi:hypothetical protein
MKNVKRLLFPIGNKQNQLTVGEPTKSSLEPISKQTFVDLAKSFIQIQ